MPVPQQSVWPIQFNIATYGVGANSVLPVIIPFGTDGLLPGIIVKSVSVVPMISEVTIENGTGQTVTEILINDGDEIDFTCVDDRNKTNWPIAGSTVVFQNPQPNGTSATNETFMTINNNYNVQAKQVGERTIKAKRYLLITPTNM
jgi:hypothetical protein